MNVVVVGPGAMGCLLAGLLAEAGHGIVLLDRDEARAQALTNSGITIEDDGGIRRVPVSATVDTACLRDVQLIFLCVKSTQTSAAMSTLRGCMDSSAAIVSLQNGLGNLEQIAEAAGQAAAVAGATSLGATRLGCGHVRHAGSGATLLSAWDADGVANAGRAAKVLTEAGVDAKVVAGCRSMLWSKLLVSAAINPLTAIAGICNGGVLEDAGLWETVEAVVAEVMAVADAQQIQLMFTDGAAEVKRVCIATSKNVSSMLQDVRAGRGTEIDAINGKVVQLGQAAGVDVPANCILVEAIRAQEALT